MAGIKLEGFEGLVPRTSDRLLPAMAATTARNTKLLQGELRGFRAPTEEADFTAEYFTVQRVFRVQDVADAYYGDTWLVFDSKEVDVVRSPVVNDSFDRYYWAGDGRPKYNTRNRIFNDRDSFYLGVPRPASAPSVTPPASGSSDTERAYVYTFVSAYGEEGQPSDPTIAQGEFGTWSITGMDTTVPDSGNRNITHKNIYRTVPGEDDTAYFFVEQIPLTQASYSDDGDDTDVVLNDLLESQSWAEPITDMEGWALMPNGYLVGWSGRRLVFSEPYRPHAWPPEYELSTNFEIVGCVVWGTTLIIGTKSQPYIGHGVTPAAFTMEKMDAVEPCLSRRGMVATVAGAYYPSINGLTLVNSNGVKNITQDILTKEEWLGQYDPENIFAAQLGLQYIAFTSENFGFVFNPTEPKTKLVELDRFDNVSGIETDPYSGNVQLISENRLWNWDPENTERLFWRWKSKQFQVPKPLNFGAFHINFDAADNDITDYIATYYEPYNESRFNEGALNTLAGHTLCGDPQGVDLVEDWTEPELRMPLGGDLLYPVEFIQFQQPAVRFIVHTRKGVIMDTVVGEERIVRMPTGYKSDLWQFELIGNTTVYSVQIAETPRGLARI